MRPQVDGIGTLSHKINQLQRILEMVQNSASDDQIVALLPIFERLDEITEPEFGPRQSQYFFRNQAAHKRTLVCLDCIDSRPCRFEHAGMATFERPKFEHVAVL